MGFTHAVCTSCKKEIQVPTDVPQANCMYCGAKVFSDTENNSPSHPTVVNLLGMARTGLSASNFQESESYFNRVLELDPNIPEAWIGKGVSAGWQSTIANMRFAEVITCFNHAIATSSAETKDATLSNCVFEANKLVATLHGISRNHLIEYAAVPDTWQQYIANTSNMLTTLDAARAWSDQDRVTLENIVHLCKDNIEGITFRDQFDNNTSKAWTLSKSYEDQLRAKMNEASSVIRQLDPTYQPPTAEAKKPESCFVVTATMGDQDHPTVKQMRLFRDQWLLKQPGGAGFVAWYYRHGPKAAKLIEGSKIRRAVTYVLVVKPLALLAHVIMVASK